VESNGPSFREKSVSHFFFSETLQSCIIQSGINVELGIGLKIVNRIIDLHDGETNFEGESGVSSPFFF
jgi:hypothetical protein